MLFATKFDTKIDKEQNLSKNTKNCTHHRKLSTKYAKVSKKGANLDYFLEGVEPWKCPLERTGHRKWPRIGIGPQNYLKMIPRRPLNHGSFLDFG